MINHLHLIEQEMLSPRNRRTRHALVQAFQCTCGVFFVRGVAGRQRKNRVPEDGAIMSSSRLGIIGEVSEKSGPQARPTSTPGHATQCAACTFFASLQDRGAGVAALVLVLVEVAALFRRVRRRQWCQDNHPDISCYSSRKCAHRRHHHDLSR